MRGEPCVRPAIHHIPELPIHKLLGPNGTNLNSLGRVMQAFKSLTTRQYIKQVRLKKWPSFERSILQRNDYEHIIRNDDDLNRIREYIINNPSQWSIDKENPARLCL